MCDDVVWHDQLDKASGWDFVLREAEECNGDAFGLHLLRLNFERCSDKRCQLERTDGYEVVGKVDGAYLP